MQWRSDLYNWNIDERRPRRHWKAAAVKLGVESTTAAAATDAVETVIVYHSAIDNRKTRTAICQTTGLESEDDVNGCSNCRDKNTTSHWSASASLVIQLKSATHAISN